MCEPVTIASIGLRLVGNANTAYGQYEHSRAQAKAHRINAKILEEAARDTIQRAAREAGAVRELSTQIIGAQVTAAGVYGVALDSDVVQGLAQHSRELAELDVRDIQWNAAREAWGLRMGAAQERQAARQAIRTGNLAIAATILTSVGQAGIGAAQAGLRPAPSPPVSTWGNRTWGLGARTNNPWL